MNTQRSKTKKQLFVLVRWVDEDKFSVEKADDVTVEPNQLIELNDVYEIYYKSGSKAYQGEIIFKGGREDCESHYKLLIDIENNTNSNNTANNQNDKNSSIASSKNTNKRGREDLSDDNDMQIAKKALVERDSLLKERDIKIELLNKTVSDLNTEIEKYKLISKNMFSDNEIKNFIKLSVCFLKIYGKPEHLSELLVDVEDANNVLLWNTFPTVFVPKALKDDVRVNFKKKKNYSITGSFRILFKKGVNNEEKLLNSEPEALLQEYGLLASAAKEFINSLNNDPQEQLTDENVVRIIAQIHNESTSKHRQQLAMFNQIQSSNSSTTISNQIQPSNSSARFSNQIQSSNSSTTFSNSFTTPTRSRTASPVNARIKILNQCKLKTNLNLNQILFTNSNSNEENVEDDEEFY